MREGVREQVRKVQSEVSVRGEGQRQGVARSPGQVRSDSCSSNSCSYLLLLASSTSLSQDSRTMPPPVRRSLGTAGPGRSNFRYQFNLFLLLFDPSSPPPVPCGFSYSPFCSLLVLLLPLLLLVGAPNLLPQPHRTQSHPARDNQAVDDLRLLLQKHIPQKQVLAMLLLLLLLLPLLLLLLLLPSMIVWPDYCDTPLHQTADLQLLI